MTSDVLHGDCNKILKELKKDPNFPKIHCTFYDPPFNQGKDYAETKDNLPENEYWKWMTEILSDIYCLTVEGGSMYFMQREKNTHKVMKSLEDAGWTFQNLIIWKKLTSAVPGTYRYGKQFQIIVFATKGKRPHVFNKLRIDPPLLVKEAYARKNGVFVTDIWDDIRELTSGYFAGTEPLRKQDGDRLHNQQSPIKLLLRIILSSTMPEDHVFDPFGGTGTTAVVARNIKRKYTTIEYAKVNYDAIVKRLSKKRKEDEVKQFCGDYVFTKNLDEIWGEPVLSLAKKQYEPHVTFKKLEKLQKFGENLHKLRQEIRKEVLKEYKIEIEEVLPKINGEVNKEEDIGKVLKSTSKKGSLNTYFKK